MCIRDSPQRFLFVEACGSTKVFAGHSLHCVDLDAIYGAGPRAFVAADAIVHVDVKPVARPLRQNVLVLMLRILPGNFSPRKVADDNTQPLQGRPDRA